MRMTDTIRIANCSGFYGDRLSAAREMVEGGPIDVLTGDYLAELTMMILFRDRMKNPDAGFARTFLRQMEDVLATCMQVAGTSSIWRRKVRANPASGFFMRSLNRIIMVSSAR